MNIECLIFTATSLFDEGVERKKVVEVGSLDVNGSVRPFIEYYKPKEYIGVDITPGRGVDVICDATKLLEKFAPNSFDIVLSTELMEHVRDWRAAIHSIKAVCRPGGVIVITTRSVGFPYHGYPFDFWRYELEDMEYIFSDCVIQRIEGDPNRGVFIKVRKPEHFIEKDLSGHALYSIVTGRRVCALEEEELKAIRFKRVVWKERLRGLIYRIAGMISSKL